MIHKSDYGEITNGDMVAGQGLFISRDGERRELGTIESTARTIRRVQSGILTEEDLKNCLEINSKNIGYTPEQLREASETFIRQQDVAKENSETESVSEQDPRKE
jgi:hypothetical protein